MAVDITVDADLDFSVDLPGDRTVSGSLTGSGHQLVLRVSDPAVFAGRSDAGLIRGLADGLARQGVRVTVVAPAGPLVTLGAARTSWLQRRITGSRHIRVERGAGLWSLARGRTLAPPGGALPTSALAPPSTLWPVAPTFRRPVPQPVSTTHDPRGGGNPRLIMAPSEHPGPAERREVFVLGDDVTTIGGDAGCDIRLPGLDSLHAEIRHDERDEFVLVRVGRVGRTRVNGAPVDRAVLRTASRVDLGDWTLSFFRDEHADHGRPYGGRAGGEFGRNRSQPGRPRTSRGDLTRDDARSTYDEENE
ncbi:MAG: FHA domain-containing protein [Nocardioidaceae bacterium]